MKNLSLGLTNEDLVEVDEFLVMEFNKGSEEEDSFRLSNIDKGMLLEYSNTWIRATIDSEMFHKSSHNSYYQINLPACLKNRCFEVFFRIKNSGNKVQFFDKLMTNAHSELSIQMPCIFTKKVKFSDIIDIWYRLLIPPTQQYSTVK